MPRTKRVSKKRNYSNVSSSSQSSDSKLSTKSNANQLIIADINRQFDAQMAKLDKELENSIELLRRAYELAKLQIPKAMLDAPFVDDDEKKEAILSKYSGEVTSSTMDSSSPIVPQPPLSSVTKTVQHTVNKPRTRNSSKDSGNEDEPLPTHPPTLNRFRTPVCNIGAGGKYNVITPKVQPNSVLAVLRRPREGEMALSMSGSPLLVSSITHESMANVNVPLPNGAVMSILPQAGLRPHDLPNMDSETVQQLRQLKENLTSLLNEDF